MMNLCCAEVGMGGALLGPTLLHRKPSLSFSFPFASAPNLSFTSPPSLHFLLRPHAKRKPSFSPPPQQDDELILDDDDDFRESINQLSTDAVKAMLSDNMKRMDELREKLLDLELYFQKEEEKDALLFILVISSMLDHRLLPEAKQLKGIYWRAFQKICNIVEDSGWVLKGDEKEFGVEMVDDELIPPTIMSEYQ